AHVIQNNQRTLLRYLYHFLQTIDITMYVHGNIPKFTGKDILALQIQLPPLAVQRKIVRILDKFTLYSQELAAELAARRAQYGYYRDKLLSQNVNSNIQIVRLGDICQVYDGTHQTPKYTNSG